DNVSNNAPAQFPVGTTTVTWTVTDIHGNTATCNQTVTVVDNQPPTFTRPPDITIYRNTTCGYNASVSATGDVTNEADNCGVGQATYSDIIDNSDACNLIITRTWHLVDNNGNHAADQVQTITVRDNIPPTFSAPTNITIYTNSICSYNASPTLTGNVTNESDNCS
ncbi:MAG: HYR domain-containing protein, partial [Bacteroidales bacterium]|nr:HYR domain-containing protein [Bacteroidales bacterium]